VTAASQAAVTREIKRKVCSMVVWEWLLALEAMPFDSAREITSVDDCRHGICNDGTRRRSDVSSEASKEGDRVGFGSLIPLYADLSGWRLNNLDWVAISPNQIALSCHLCDFYPENGNTVWSSNCSSK
jgi:hypothetical protein